MGMFDKETGAFKSSPEIERLLLQRKRIIHKAMLIAPVNTLVRDRDDCVPSV